MEFLTPFFYWTFLGLVFIVAELFFYGFFFALALSASSFIAAFCSLLDYSIEKCLIIFMVSTPISFFILKLICKKYTQHIYYKSSLEENFHQDYHILKDKSTHHIPKIIYQGILWSVKEKDNKKLYNNDRVKTLYIKGNSFIVTKIK